MKVLLIEDDLTLNGKIAERLQQEGFKVDTCLDGEEAIERIRVSSYAVLIIELMIPKIDGLSILQQVHAMGNNVLVLMISENNSLDSKLECFNLGADDYLVKPFDLEELIARVHALVRRTMQQGAKTLNVGPVEINRHKREVRLEGKIIELTTKEFDFIYYLISNKNIVVSRQQILDNVWEYDYEMNSNLIDVYIKSLRKKIAEKTNYKLIQTVRGVGYVFKWDADD